MGCGCGISRQTAPASTDGLAGDSDGPSGVHRPSYQSTPLAVGAGNLLPDYLGQRSGVVAQHLVIGHLGVCGPRRSVRPAVAGGAATRAVWADKTSQWLLLPPRMLRRTRCLQGWLTTWQGVCLRFVDPARETRVRSKTAALARPQLRSTRTGKQAQEGT